MDNEIRNQDLPLPNVYWVTVVSATHGTHTLYVAGDFSGEVVRKVQNHCAHELGFRPHRGNADIRLRRFRLGDYLECPEGLQAAGEFAAFHHERDIVEALAARKKHLAARTGTVDLRGLEAAIGEALREAG